MVLFWSRSYHDVGTRQIEDEAGITRFTLQTTYRGKMSLFLQALDQYLDLYEAQFLPPATPGSCATLAHYFSSRSAPPTYAEERSNGCFMLNTMIEFAGENPEIRARSDRFYLSLISRLEAGLVSLKEAGQLRSDYALPERARILASSYKGMEVSVRAAHDNCAAEPLGNATARMIEDWAIAA
jgi:TetR/AcrR family transcriptional repressor of nem operon